MTIKKYELQNPYGVVNTKGLEIISFEEKPIQVSYVNAGIYAINPSSLKYLKSNERCDMPDFFERIKKNKNLISAYPIHETWADVGRPMIYFKQTKTRKAVFEKKKIFAVVGLGNISRRHRKNLKLLFPSAQVAALASSNRQLDNLPESCDILTKSLDELLALNPDFVIIASPATFHAKHAIPFIKNNIPVLIEKPIAANLQDSKKIENCLLKN